MISSASRKVCRSILEVFYRHSRGPNLQQQLEQFVDNIIEHVEQLPTEDWQTCLVEKNNRLIHDKFPSQPSSALFNVGSIKLIQVIFSVAYTALASVSDVMNGANNKDAILTELQLLLQPILSKCILSVIPYVACLDQEIMDDAGAVARYQLICKRLGSRGRHKNNLIDVIPSNCHSVIAALAVHLETLSDSTMPAEYLPWAAITAMVFGWEAGAKEHRPNTSYKCSSLPNLSQLAIIVRGCAKKCRARVNHSGPLTHVNEVYQSVGSDVPTNVNSFATIHHVVMADYMKDADPSVLALGFARTDWADKLIQGGPFDLQILSPESRASLLSGYKVPDDHQQIFDDRPEIWNGPPTYFTVNYQTDSGAEFSVRIFKTLVTPEMYSFLFSMLDGHPVIHGRGGRSGSLVYVVTNDKKVTSAPQFAVGKGEADQKVLLYPAVMGPLKPLDSFVFELCNLFMRSAQQSALKELEMLQPGEPKGYHPVPANMIFALIAPGTDPGFAGNLGHSDFNPGIGRMDNELFSKVNLPTCAELVIPTVVLVPPEFVGQPEAETYLQYTDATTERVLTPVGTGWATGTRCLTAGAHVQGQGSQKYAKHKQVPMNGATLPRECCRTAFTGRPSCLPGPCFQHEIQDRGCVAPCAEQRLETWYSESGGVQFSPIDEGYLLFKRGNFATLLSATPEEEGDSVPYHPVGDSQDGSHNPAEDSGKEDEGDDGTKSDQQGPPTQGSPDRKQTPISLWKSKLMNADYPFGTHQDISRPTFVLGSEFSLSESMLHIAVCKKLLMEDQINVKFVAHSPVSNKRETRSQFHRTPDGKLFRPGKFYLESAIRSDMELVSKESCPTNQLCSILESSASVGILSHNYKNETVTVEDNFGCAIQTAKVPLDEGQRMEEALDVIKEPVQLVIDGAGGSSMCSSQSKAKINKLGQSENNTGFVLTLSEGQSSVPLPCQLAGGSAASFVADNSGIPGENAALPHQVAGAINFHLNRLTLNKRPIAMFLKPSIYFGKRGSKNAEDFKKRMREERNIVVEDDDIFGKDTGDGKSQLVFLRYFFVDRSELGSDYDDVEAKKTREGSLVKYMKKLGMDRVRNVQEPSGDIHEDDMDRKPAATNQAPVVQPSVSDFRTKPFFKFIMYPAFSTREMVYLSYCEDHAEDYQLTHLLVNKDNHQPYTYDVDLETSNQITGGRNVFTIHDMRKDLQGRGVIMVESLNTQLEPVEEEEGNDNDMAEAQTTSLPPLPMEKLQEEIGENKKTLQKTCHETIGIVFCNIHSGLLRIMGASTVEKVNLSGERMGYLATSLAAPYLPSINRLYPSPMACRALDIVPLATILNAITLSLCKPAAGDIPTLMRLDLIEWITVLAAKDDPHGSRLSPAQQRVKQRIHGVLRNVPLFRLTGNLAYALQLTAFFRAMSPSDLPDGYVNGMLFGLPIVDGPGDDVWNAFESFLRKHSKVGHKGRGPLRLEELFAKLHFHQIPKVVRSSTENLIKFCRKAVYTFGEDFQRIITEIYQESLLNPAPIDDREYVRWCWGNQKLLRDKLLKLAVGQWDGTGATKEKDWEFVAQAMEIDVEGPFFIPLLEPHRTHVVTTEDDGVEYVIEGPEGVDPNHVAVAPFLVCCANGSSEAMAYIRKATGIVGLQLYDFYVELLEQLRSLSPEFLQCIGLTSVEFSGIRVIIDIFTGSIWNLRSCEHWLCKVYLCLKHRFPNDSSSKNPNAHSAHCHPLFIVREDATESMPFHYSIVGEGVVSKFASRVIASFHEWCAEGPYEKEELNIMTTGKSEYFLTCPMDPFPGYIPRGNPTYIRHQASVALYPTEPDKHKYRGYILRMVDKICQLPSTKKNVSRWVRYVPGGMPMIKATAEKRSRASAVDQVQRRIEKDISKVFGPKLGGDGKTNNPKKRPTATETSGEEERKRKRIILEDDSGSENEV